MSTNTTTALATLTNPPSSDASIEQLAATVLDRLNHEHPQPGSGGDLYCLNLLAFLGERMGNVLTRLRDAEARLEQARADERARCVAELRTHSAERMAESISSFASGNDNALATVRYASTIEAPARFLESGEHVCATRPDSNS